MVASLVEGEGLRQLRGGDNAAQRDRAGDVVRRPSGGVDGCRHREFPQREPATRHPSEYRGGGQEANDVAEHQNSADRDAVDEHTGRQPRRSADA